MNRILTLLFFLSLSATSFGQTIVSGILQNADGRPIAGVKVVAVDQTTTSDDAGFFRITVPSTAESVLLTFSKTELGTLEKMVRPKGQSQVSLGVVNLQAAEAEEEVDDPNLPRSSKDNDLITGEDRIPIITLSGDAEESDLGPQNISGILSASRDPFIAAAAFNLSTGGFDIRGFRSETTVLFNGMPFNNLENGAVYWSVWGGLNDVTRNRESAIDLRPSSWTFGGLGGFTVFDTRASEQRKQRRVSYMFANRSYNGRLMGTWSTGMMKNGWAFSFSGSKRWAQEGYVPGTFYNAHSYFASIDRKLGDNHLLNLTALGSPVRRGSQGASVQELNDLAGTNFYNPNWGYQNGEKRNARVTDAHQPLFILRHDWKINERSTLTTSIGHQTGRYGRTSLDWFKAPDPRPNYYRNLPSYELTDPDNPNPALAQQMQDIYSDNPELLQIQWDDFYWGNVNNGKSYDGRTGNWSQVILSDLRSDARRWNASSTLETILSDHVTINMGVTYQDEENHYFKTVDDLLGGDYYVNIDRFALFDNLTAEQARFDLNAQGDIVLEGDKHGWDYDINGRKIGTWVQGQFSFRKVDFFAAGSMTTTEFWRTGHFRNGRYPDNSFGESERQEFANYAAKAGVTYKIDGRNYLYFNGSLLNRAPDARIAYASPRNRDQLVPGLTDEKVEMWEAGFQHRSPGLRARATFYHIQLNDGMKLNRFFMPATESNFGTYILTGLDERHAGIEVAAQAKLSTTLTANAAASISENIYTSRPNGIFIQDDDGVIRDRGTIFVKNFYIPSTPQTALSFGLDYRSPKFWSASVTVNYFDRTYLDFSPERRTREQVFGMEVGSDDYRRTTEQINVFDESDIGFQVDHFSVDLFAYKSFKINYNTIFSLTAGVTNLLNANIIQGGYEQLRYEENRISPNGDNPFAPRYFYAYGTNFFVLGALRF